MAEASEADHGNAYTRPDIQRAQRLPDSDARTHQRCRRGRIQPLGKSVGEIFADNVLPREPAQGRRSVDTILPAIGQGGKLVAEVLLSCPAHGALTAGIDDVAHRDIVADGKGCHLEPNLADDAGELVPWDEARVTIMVTQCLQVAVAEPAVVDPHSNVIRAQFAPLQRGCTQFRGTSRLPSSGRSHHRSS